MVRKIRIGAGGFQALALTKSLLHPRFGFRSFAFWGHKVLRWCVPLALLVGIVSNLAMAHQTFYFGVLCVQALGAGIALAAYRSRSRSALPRWTRPISYFYLMNFALLCGFFRFLSGTQRVTWDRATPASANGITQDRLDSLQKTVRGQIIENDSQPFIAIHYRSPQDQPREAIREDDVRDLVEAVS
jgi:hypothetical protein